MPRYWSRRQLLHPYAKTRGMALSPSQFPEEVMSSNLLQEYLILRQAHTCSPPGAIDRRLWAIGQYVRSMWPPFSNLHYTVTTSPKGSQRYRPVTPASRSPAWLESRFSQIIASCISFERWPGVAVWSTPPRRAQCCWINSTLPT